MSPQGRKVSLEHTPVQQLAFSPLPNNRLITLSVVVVTYVKRSPINRLRSPRSCLVPRHPLTAALSIYGPTAPPPGKGCVEWKEAKGNLVLLTRESGSVESLFTRTFTRWDIPWPSARLTDVSSDSHSA